MVYKECPVCGKVFLHNTQSIFHVTYNGKKIYLCGYDCKNKFKKQMGIRDVRRMK